MCKDPDQDSKKEVDPISDLIGYENDPSRRNVGSCFKKNLSQQILRLNSDILSYVVSGISGWNERRKRMVKIKRKLASVFQLIEA